jgi:hypothetical protein
MSHAPDNEFVPRLTVRQLWITGAIGAALWLAAALLLNVLGPRGIYEGSNRVVLYLLVIPGTWPVLPMMAKLAGLAKTQLGLGMAFGTAVATLLDGLALAWWPALYGGPDYVAGAGAVILWGAGVGMMYGFWTARRR